MTPRAQAEAITRIVDHLFKGEVVTRADLIDAIAAALAATEAKYREALEQADEALAGAEEWLGGWASAEPYLSAIQDARTRAAAILATAGEAAAARTQQEEIT